jgi:hypothetical protein
MRQIEQKQDQFGRKIKAEELCVLAPPLYYSPETLFELHLEPALTDSAASCVFSPPRSISRPIPFTVLQPIEAKIPASEIAMVIRE